MSGWQLGLVLFGCWLAGVGCGLIFVYLYARRLFKQKMGQLLGQLTSTGGGPAPVTVTTESVWTAPTTSTNPPPEEAA